MAHVAADATYSVVLAPEHGRAARSLRIYRDWTGADSKVPDDRLSGRPACRDQPRPLWAVPEPSPAAARAAAALAFLGQYRRVRRLCSKARLIPRQLG